MRRTIEEKLLRLVRLYTFHTPIRKGKYAIYQAARAVCRERFNPFAISLPDGRRLYADPTTDTQASVFFVGEFERVLTQIAVTLIAKGDVCVDAGANFGWYTSLMALHSGNDGAVHAFEPTPQSFSELQRNAEFMGPAINVVLNNHALGDAPGSVQIHVFEGMGSGHASLAAKDGVDSTAFECKMITLDNYIIENGIRGVDFVKVDIEGAELMFLKGAERLFAATTPPIFLMEMATGQTQNFGYHPNELIEFIGSRGDYEFFAVDEYAGTIKLIEAFGPGEIGANVFCIPRNAPPAKRAAIEKYLVK